MSLRYFGALWLLFGAGFWAAPAWSSGSVDLTFDAGVIGGGASTDVPKVTLQPDGKVLIGGTFLTVGGMMRNSIARLNPDGSVDTTFNANILAPGVFAIAVQPDGKILIGGFFSIASGTPRNSIARPEYRWLSGYKL